MEAERRIGKTSILHKMEAEPPPGWEPISLDLEQVHSAAEFAERVCEKIQGRLTGWKKQGRRIGSFLESLGGTQVGPMMFPEKKSRPDGYWKTLLNDAVEDLVEQQHVAGKRVVFLFDEMPWMLSAIADPQRDGAQTDDGSAGCAAKLASIADHWAGFPNGAVWVRRYASHPCRVAAEWLQKPTSQ